MTLVTGTSVVLGEWWLLSHLVFAKNNRTDILSQQAKCHEEYKEE